MLHTLTTALTTGLLALHGWPVYLVIGVLAFLEAAAFVGLVVPGETGLTLGGVRVTLAEPGLPEVIETRRGYGYLIAVDG